MHDDDDDDDDGDGDDDDDDSDDDDSEDDYDHYNECEARWSYWLSHVLSCIIIKRLLFNFVQHIVLEHSIRDEVYQNVLKEIVDFISSDDASFSFLHSIQQGVQDFCMLRCKIQQTLAE